MRTLALLLAAPALLAAGCGGDEGSDGAPSNGSTDPAASIGSDGSNRPAGAGEGSGGASAGTLATSSLSKAQYLKRANAICRRGRLEREREVAAFSEENANLSEEEGFEATFQEVVVPGMEAQIAELRELRAPHGDRKRVDAFLGATESWVGIIKKRGVTAQDAINRALSRAGRLARAYGLRECAFT